ncbi:MAG TPA: hypothetical protein DEB33_09100 [Gemmatimonadetes bacterium]|nr:hypothetical protein [Gemmatimonadota bacterium]HCK61349.1 hypothetical protein [Gemmatimonadota bacterium]HCW77946.1 hypothetical protein [Gemmatimonadota bacterium]
MAQESKGEILYCDSVGTYSQDHAQGELQHLDKYETRWMTDPDLFNWSRLLLLADTKPPRRIIRSSLHRF